MDIPVADWVLQTTTTVGTGTITLSLPAPGYTDLQDALKSSGEVWYSLLSSNGDRECGIGYFDYDTNTLQRTTIHATLKNGKHSNVSPTPIELKGQSLVSCTFNAESWKQFITEVQVGNVYSLPSTSDPEVTNTGTHSVPVLNFGIPKGDKGDAATIAIASTVTGNPGTPAGVTNEGDEHNALLKFTIPGSVEVSVGSTTTLDSGSQATVVDGNTDLDKVVLNFGIPRGTPGLNGTGAVVNTVADLRVAPTNGTVTTLGCITVGDGGGGFWRWDETSTAEDNVGTVVQSTSTSGAGRWVRSFLNQVSVAWFGANGTGDETDILQKALNASIGRELIFTPNVTYTAYMLKIGASTVLNLNGATIKKRPYDEKGLTLYQASEGRYNQAGFSAWDSTKRYYIDCIAISGSTWYRARRPFGSTDENVNKTPASNPDWWVPFVPASTVSPGVFWTNSTEIAAPLLYIKGDNVVIRNGKLDGNRQNETYLATKWGGAFAVQGNRALILASSSEIIVSSNGTLEGVNNLTIDSIRFENAYGTCICTEWVKNKLLITNCIERNSGNLFYFIVGETAYYGAAPNYHRHNLAGTAVITNNFISGDRALGYVMNPAVSVEYQELLFNGNTVTAEDAIVSGGVKSGAQRAIYSDNIFINEYIKPQYGSDLLTESLVVTGNSFVSKNIFRYVTGVVMGIHATKSITIANNSIINGNFVIDRSSYAISITGNSGYLDCEGLHPLYGASGIDWNSSTVYAEGDVVKYNNTYQYSLADNNVGNVPDTTQYSKWVSLRNAWAFIAGSESAGAAWSATTTYKTDIIAVYQDNWYVCALPRGENSLNQQPDLYPEVWQKIPPLVPTVNVSDNNVDLGGFLGNDFMEPIFALNVYTVKNNTVKGADYFMGNCSPSSYRDDKSSLEVTDNTIINCRKLVQLIPMDKVVSGNTYSMYRFVFSNNRVFDINYSGATDASSYNTITGGVSLTTTNGSLKELVLQNNVCFLGDGGAYNQFLLSATLVKPTIDKIILTNNITKGSSTNSSAYHVTIFSSTNAVVGYLHVDGNVSDKTWFFQGFTATKKVLYHNFFPNSNTYIFNPTNEIIPAASVKSTAVITGGFSTTVGTAGSASALPTQPQGYVEIMLDQTPFKIPYYKAS